MKNFFKILAVTVLTFLFPLAANAATSVVIDGKIVNSDSNGSVVTPFVYEGSTYAPVRAIAEALNTTVAWDMETKTVHLGTVGGSPELNENINIYYNGKEYICKDVNGNAVYPIMKDNVTYLPIRGIGSLFNKTILWDNLTQTAVMTTKANENELNYLKASIDNTSKMNALFSLVTVEGTLSQNGNVFSNLSNSTSEPYSPIGFSLTAFLPDNYESNMSYLGGGNYFLVVSPERFSSDPTLQKALFDNQTPTTFSNLYIFASAKGGYLTSASIYFAGKLSYNNIEFDQEFKITAQMQYPEGFTFPIAPYPDGSTTGETSVTPSIGENDDSTVLIKLVSAYTDNLLAAQPSAVFSLLHPSDYKTMFSNKSTSQLNLDMKQIQKNLDGRYQDAEGSYEITSLVYTTQNDITPAPDKYAKAVVSVNYLNGEEMWIEDIEVFAIKRDGKWYLSPTTAEIIYSYK